MAAARMRRCDARQPARRAGTSRRAGGPRCPASSSSSSLRLQIGGAAAGACAQRVQAHRVEAQGAQQRVLRRGIGVIGCRARGAAPWRCVPRRSSSSTSLHRLDQLGALADQRMAAARLRRMDRAGNGEHLLALLGRQPGGDQRARLQRRLHHQRAARERRDDAVALREVLVERRRAERELAHDQAACRDAVRQVAVPGRVDAVQSRADHRHRRQAARVAGAPRARLRGPRRRRRAPAPTPP